MADKAWYPVPDLVRRRATAEGQVGLDWLASLDEVLASLERDWGLTIGPAISGGSTAFVAEVTDQAEAVFVIKVSTPGSEIGRREADVLTAADGKGYVRLLRHDRARHAMLLERLGTPLHEHDMPYRNKIDIMCGTLLDAWMPAPAGGAYTTGADKANSLAMAILEKWQQLGRPCSQPVLDMALMYCRDRAAAWRPENAVLAHGDPHPANILDVPETEGRRWKFIDPDGLAIEPAYDLGVLLRAWHEGVAGRHAHDIARSHARHLTSRTQVPAEAIWQWGYIERISTGLHLMELGEVEKGREFLTVAEALTQAEGG
ncbi:aminoglycoside phosphotransferase family protein [Devosia ginsengisoli]|uniref:aminoglycoside phosphotransferase family protein n=1 Tax=Devosia ginsengisoli TaxID=400770 RepID=UPI0026F0187F|nr:aminoglycoside phosphotransferase family protein [Devosia ginsengisoli]MCR6671744.1 aminoglycoside phosphotransferase family protein [Devosia ginsengisoli]